MKGFRVLPAREPKYIVAQRKKERAAVKLERRRAKKAGRILLTVTHKGA
jgi:hypothetical protein